MDFDRKQSKSYTPEYEIVATVCTGVDILSGDALSTQLLSKVNASSPPQAYPVNAGKFYCCGLFQYLNEYIHTRDTSPRTTRSSTKSNTNLSTGSMIVYGVTVCKMIVSWNKRLQG